MKLFQISNLRETHIRTSQTGR